MYHGSRVPGFPSHPHRGFETVTVVKQGFVDHADSMNAAGRYGAGDTQWMTAGAGVQHSEMFPLLNQDSDNPMELFQIWLNLPARSKMVAPHFKMLWREQTPQIELLDSNGRKTTIDLITGSYSSTTNSAVKAALAPPPNSWAADSNNHVRIWTVKIDAQGKWQLPASNSSHVNRMIYFYRGEQLQVEDHNLSAGHGIEADCSATLQFNNGAQDAFLLILEGQPIAEPVAQHGPFVMNSREQLLATFDDYQRTQFGGWPWPDRGQVHGGEKIRFARHANAVQEFPPQN